MKYQASGTNFSLSLLCNQMDRLHSHIHRQSQASSYISAATAGLQQYVPLTTEWTKYENENENKETSHTSTQSNTNQQQTKQK